jgi:repressor LexA
VSTGLTKRQKEILHFLEDFQGKNQTAPTIQEIQKHFRFKSPASVQQHLRLIEQKGYLSKSPHRARSIRLTGEHREGVAGPVVKVPLLGRIPAGPPAYALESVEDILTLPKRLFRGTDLFALRVAGDSMIGAGIFDGDIAVLSSRPDFTDGDIAAVVVDEEATLKRVYRLPDGLRLCAENDRYPDRIIKADSAQDCRVAGVLTGTVRQF